MSRIYVAAPLHHLAEAKAMAARLTAAGQTIVSTWHAGEPTVAGEAGLTVPDYMAVADTCVSEVLASDTLVLLYGAETTRHGSVFECGIAYGDGMRIVTCALTPDAVLPTILFFAGGIRHCGVDDVERWLT